MAEFSELIKNFNKIRDYMRDFYIYGFKSRGDFTAKSARTYDNEKRRCESYLGSSMKWTYAGGNKISFVSADCGRLPVNPLYAAWKSKSFTANDIILHFYLPDILRRGDRTVEELTAEISSITGNVFDVQTVRAKCNEYCECGLLTRQKQGKAFRYALPPGGLTPDGGLADAVKFFQGGILGEIGSYILDAAGEENVLFVFKHYYIAHALEDGIVCELLTAIHGNNTVTVETVGTKSGRPRVLYGLFPLKIIVSARSGRRYLCAYITHTRRFATYRLDGIKTVKIGEAAENAAEIRGAFARNKDKLWGVSFDGTRRNEAFSLTLRIDEVREQHIIDRIQREGRGGILERIAPDTFLYRKEVFSANEALPWVKTFIGRIISYSASRELEEKLRGDIACMAELYGIAGEKK